MTLGQAEISETILEVLPVKEKDDKLDLIKIKNVRRNILLRKQKGKP